MEDIPENLQGICELCAEKYMKKLEQANKEIKQLAKEAVDVMEGLYNFCPALAYMPADKFIEKWEDK